VLRRKDGEMRRPRVIDTQKSSATTEMAARVVPIVRTGL
jgi:hypothetical protein